MTALTCSAARCRLSAYHDGELPVDETIAVGAHLRQCRSCAFEAQEIAEVGDVLRCHAGPLLDDLDDAVHLAQRVTSRLLAEEAESWHSRTARAFEDMHLVWAGLAACGATVACAVILFVIGYLAPAPRADSISGLLAAMALPPGSNANPVSPMDGVVLPRVRGDAYVRAMFETDGEIANEEDLVFALAAVVTREGRLANPEVIQASARDGDEVVRLMNTVMQARFEPASRAGAPVAVNMVWLVARTTVKGRAHS
jgi:anti-sigma factor RsiW